MDIGLSGTFRFGLDRAMPLSESVEVIPVGPLAKLGPSGYSRLLLRRGMLAVWGSSSAISGPDNNSGLLEDTS
jgi:hypothetical protein